MPLRVLAFSAVVALLAASVIFGGTPWGRRTLAVALTRQSGNPVELYFTDPTGQRSCGTAGHVLVDFTVAAHVESAYWLSYLVTVVSGGRTETRRGEMVVADGAAHRIRVAVPLRHGPADTVGVLLEHRSEQITIACARAAG